MKHNKKFIYPKCVRANVDGQRIYDIDGGKWKLPSVTTILSHTQSAEKRESLANWRKREGEENAARIVASSGARGTAMHKILEKWVLGEGYMDMTTVGQEAHNMAKVVIEQGLSNITEYYGSETVLYYPGLYAGQTDLIANHKGDMAVVDFKQTNKPKRREWIEDYCHQLAAYTMAHNYVHRTNISKGVIMMCSKDNYYQEFIIQGLEMKKYMHQWLGKVSKYYEQRPTGS